MLSNGTMVEVFKDPLTMQRKEGNATIVGFVQELETGLKQYIVHFQGDARGFHVVRAIYEGAPICSGKDPVHCDDENCAVHGKQIRAHWVR